MEPPLARQWLNTRLAEYITVRETKGKAAMVEVGGCAAEVHRTCTNRCGVLCCRFFTRLSTSILRKIHLNNEEEQA
jgi:hypothetical protein